MSFQAPLFLIGLVAIPLALLALWAARRRPARYVVRFPGHQRRTLWFGDLRGGGHAPTPLTGQNP